MTALELSSRQSDHQAYPWLGNGALSVIASDPQTRLDELKRQQWCSNAFSETCLRDLSLICKGMATPRPECRLIVSPSNNGKSTLLRELIQRLDEWHSKMRGVGKPYICVIAPPSPGIRAFCDAIMAEAGLPIVRSETDDQRLRRLKETLELLNLRVLIIDEVQDIIAGATEKYRSMRNTLKYLSNTLRISIIAAGTKDAWESIRGDQSLKTRFRPLVLPKWKNNKEFRELLEKFIKRIPLRKPSELTEPTLQARLFKASDGRIGELFNLLVRATEVAILTEHECIDHHVLDAIGCCDLDEAWEVKHDFD